MLERAYLNRLALILCLILPAGTAVSKSLTVALVYPEVREPYHSIFMEIARGMEEQLDTSVKRYALPKNEIPIDQLINTFKSDGIDVVVTLGRAGLSVAKSLNGVIPVVVGATIVHPDEMPAGLTSISLTPDPDALFDKLRMFIPGIKKITVVYDPVHTAWEIQRAERSAKNRGIDLSAQSSSDLKESSKLIRHILFQIQDDSIALWLPRENTAMDELALMPEVLREAWDKSFVIFSSNLEHVRQGALFSLYPDNFGMGKSLANLALQSVQENPKLASVNFLQDLRLAVNLRTADHLGLHFSNQTRREFSMVFPAE